jgi:hypothetical protein
MKKHKEECSSKLICPLLHTSSASLYNFIHIPMNILEIFYRKYIHWSLGVLFWALDTEIVSSCVRSLLKFWFLEGLRILCRSLLLQKLYRNKLWRVKTDLHGFLVEYRLLIKSRIEVKVVEVESEFHFPWAWLTLTLSFFTKPFLLWFIFLTRNLPVLHSHFVFRQNGRNSFKNGRIRAVQIRPPFLVELTLKLVEMFPYQ